MGLAYCFRIEHSVLGVKCQLPKPIVAKSTSVYKKTFIGLHLKTYPLIYLFLKCLKGRLYRHVTNIKPIFHCDANFLRWGLALV